MLPPLPAHHRLPTIRSDSPPLLVVVHAEVQSGKLLDHIQLDCPVLEAIVAAAAAEAEAGAAVEADKIVATPVLAQTADIVDFAPEPVVAGIAGQAAGTLALVLVGGAFPVMEAG